MGVTKKNVCDILILILTLLNCPLEEEDNVRSTGLLLGTQRPVKCRHPDEAGCHRPGRAQGFGSPNGDPGLMEDLAQGWS